MKVGSLKYVVACGAVAVFLLAADAAVAEEVSAAAKPKHLDGNSVTFRDEDDEVDGEDGEESQQQPVSSQEDKDSLPSDLQFIRDESEAAEKLLAKAVRKDKKIKLASLGLGGAAGLATLGLLVKAIADVKRHGNGVPQAVNKAAISMAIVAALGLAGAAIATKKRRDNDNRMKQQLAALVGKRAMMLEAAKETGDDDVKEELYKRAEELADIVEGHGTHPGEQAPPWRS